jgi:hypothetical protein
MGSDRDRPGSASAPGTPLGFRYAIRVEGLLDDHWSQWLDGMTVTHEEGRVTRLEGPLTDQAALYGMLNKLRDLRLTLLTVQRLGAGDRAAPALEEPPESAA